MSKMTIDLPTPLRRAAKSFAGANGMTLRDVFISGVTDFLEKNAQISAQNKKQEFISKEEASILLKPLTKKIIDDYKKELISEKEFDQKFNKISTYLTEEEENKLLAPKIEKIINDIETGNLKTFNEEEFQKELNKKD
jgi:hypothetical protein